MTLKSGNQNPTQPRGWLEVSVLDPLRRVKGGLNQLVHPLRRRRALKQVRALGAIRRILVVCTGNVCRSPFAQLRLQEDPDLRGRIEVLSAGVMGGGARIPPAEAQAAASVRGIGMSGHRSRDLDPALAEWAHLLVVMEPRHRSFLLRRLGAPESRVLLLGDLDPQLPLYRAVPDPIDRSPEFYEDSFDRIDRCVEVLLGLLKESV